MKQEITEWGFQDAFKDAGRGEQFTHKGLKALYEDLEQMVEETGEEYTLDVVALCCEFSEYASALECINDAGYDCDLSDCEDDEEREVKALEYLQQNTAVIEFDGGIIIGEF